jgi:hypothetical protein
MRRRIKKLPAEYLPFSALKCGYRQQAQIGQFGAR